MEVYNYSEYYLIKHLMTSLKHYHYITYLHSIRVAKLTYLVSKKLGLPKKEQIYNCKGGLLHDIGKVLVPVAILDKPGSLTELEYEFVKIHPSYGAEMLKIFPSLRDLIPGVLYHHERLDGSGYPFGVSIIPLNAQIIGICDSFDAMTTKRPYNEKRLKSIHEAIFELKTQPQKYNYKIVEALEEVLWDKKGDQQHFISI
ncbi:HD-GYP domain-containing protein [Thermoanaerobacter siderophilus]|uniref:Putative domain HDIG-containing protein n=1 Tax=Thermoanaerobacter siderophilus SR4 TaxID=880478 RepID=I9AAV2_9THEO|nr:HD domain-containing phosphohydrolase [Thermoanaerobacter siderophilus]EIV99141.1 putative domain HDIG-containing protein [Thermoanaerobacter siderophilus SR4]